MNDLAQFLALAGVLGSGAIGGVFFAFSSFVMPALGRLSNERGLAAMQSINVAVIRPSFLGTFMGTALLSLGTVVLASLHWGESGAALLAAGGALYFVGTFLVTIICNVPLNNSLESWKPDDPHAAPAWRSYVRRWTIWNHVRTVASLLATLAFCLSLTQPAKGSRIPHHPYGIDRLFVRVRSSFSALDAGHPRAFSDSVAFRESRARSISTRHPNVRIEVSKSREVSAQRRKYAPSLLRLPGRALEASANDEPH